MKKYEVDTINDYAKYVSHLDDKFFMETLENIKNIFINNGFTLITNVTHFNIDNELIYQLIFMDDKYDNEYQLLLIDSYANGTSIRFGDDINLLFINETYSINNYPKGKSGYDFGYEEAKFDIVRFKEDLLKIFIDNGFKRVNNNKFITIASQDYEDNKRNINIIPCFRYKDFSLNDVSKSNKSVNGILIKTNDGKEIIKYPEIDFKENTKKNDQTFDYYKEVVRILKNIMFDMQNDGFNTISESELEDLIFNVDNEVFLSVRLRNNDAELKPISLNVLKYLYENRNDIKNWYEPNGILLIYDNKNRYFNKTKKFIEDMYNYYK